MMIYSSNHKQITGDFAEHLVMYWLSKNNYECVHVRHIGIDVIASKDGQRLGISVKSRSRKPNEIEYGFTMTKPYSHLENISNACSNFACTGYFAFILDQNGIIVGYLLPVNSVKKYYNPHSELKSQDWNIRKFSEDQDAIKIELNWR